jgi:glutamyl-tRNA synthetase
MRKEKVKTRFAPTPSGFLHQGNGFNFILTSLLTQSAKGSIHLRIDDYDTTRCRDEYIQDIFETLNWLELKWDTGPRNLIEFKKFYSSKLRIKQFQQYLYKIRKKFICECSRKDLLSESGNNKYPGTCYLKDLHYQPHLNSIKFKSRDKNDFILWTKDNHPSYQLASLVDDVELGINLIVRGSDLKQSTQFQLQLAQELNLKTFEEVYFFHHDLVVDDKKDKLSKSQDSKSLKQRRESGMPKEEFYKEFNLFFNLNILGVPTLEKMKMALLKTSYKLI